jgi:hypothetical protein
MHTKAYPPYPLPREIQEFECRPLMDPGMVPAAEAGHMRADDVVLGLELDGEARAYPWWIMDNHHVANDTVAGRPVVIVLCEACSTGLALDPIVNGRRLTFEARYFYQGTLALRDHQTRSTWATYLGKAIRGRLKGAELELLPLFQLEWHAWRDLHPETLVLPDEPGAREGHGSEFTIGSPLLPEEWGKRPASFDPRLPNYALVLGVVTPTAQRAYRLSTLREAGGVLDDELGGLPIVAMLHLAEGSYGALAFSRVLDGRTLTFEASPEGAVDRESGSLWTARGRAVAGPLAGRQLAFVTSHIAKWFVWAKNYPSIEIA